MRLPSQTIWDTRIQCVCGIIAAEGEAGPEIYFSANFAQATLEPPRLIINPNRIYPIEPAIRRAGRFSVAVLPDSAPTSGSEPRVVQLRPAYSERGRRQAVVTCDLSVDEQGPFTELACDARAALGHVRKHQDALCPHDQVLIGWIKLIELSQSVMDTLINLVPAGAE